MITPRSTIPRFACAAATLLLAATLSAQPPDKPRPLDPLTPRERVLADSVARSDPRLRDLIGREAPVLVDVGFIAGKPRRAIGDGDAEVARQAAVQYFLRARNTGVTALVDLATAKVLDVTRVRGADVPLAEEEVTRAARLALADERVRKLFDGRMPEFRLQRAAGEATDTASTRIDGIRLMGPPGDRCAIRRCVALFFRVDNSYVQLGRVVVDLLNDSVMVKEGAR
jgi:hypothetical protein